MTRTNRLDLDDRYATTGLPPLATALAEIRPHQPARTLHPHAPRVYLAGPIAGSSYDTVTGWRDDMATALAPDIAALSPMRAKHYLSHLATIEDSRAYSAFPLSTDAAIVARDRMDCMKSDLVVMNLLGATRATLGSMIEVGWADAARVPLLLVIEDEGNLHDHGMVRALAGWRVSSLVAATHMVRAILLPG